MPIHRVGYARYLALSSIAAAAALLASCGGSDSPVKPPESKFSAEIRRTTMGVPHIKAKDWGSLGYGVGYAQAQDNLCTIADSMLTYRGERSRHFGGEALAVYNSTIAQPRNIDSDFYFRQVISDENIVAMEAAQPEKLIRMVEGFAAGYNRYVKEVKSGQSKANAACGSQDWVQPITADDIWRRAYAAGLAGGYANFVAAIANAQPPVTKTASAKSASLQLAAMKAPELQVGGKAGIGSNVYGFGTTGTAGDSPLLFGNPHWYWKGPDRFYQMQLTIDGEVDASGAAFLGLPIVQIGFNNNVAWSHTVSTARRFGFFVLGLDPKDPTRYMMDGQSVPMTAKDVTIGVRNANGGVDQVTRTMYQSEHGPIVNLASLNPAMGWTAQSAVAIRDINAGNYRTLRTWMRWNQAKSLDEFTRIQREEAAIPWVNTVAVGRDSKQAWYADLGAVPNAPDALLKTCTTPFSAAAAVALPRVPVLSGASAACKWVTDTDSVQAGAIGVSRMPTLMREDYVGNMNDSYWLSNVNQPLTGFPAIFGQAGTQSQSLRTRLGHTMAVQRLAGSDGYAGKSATSEIVRQMVLDSRVQSAQFKDQILALVCGSSASGDRAPACSALAAWDGKGSKTSTGSHVWDEFWTNLIALSVPEATLYKVQFNPADPLNTPRDINPAAAAQIGKAFDAAVATVKASGIAFDAARGSVLYVTRSAQRLPLFGGCSAVGYFTVDCSQAALNQAGYAMDNQPHGNSYMQVVSFPKGGVDAYTFLTFSLSDDPASPHYGDYTQAYSAQQWLKVPFTEAEIAANPELVKMQLSE
ncbi:penicillin acylase family protein [Comamonas testosteroni]|uniref:penicillin acylase family protein n=1 Tax=Comamonas testosteroni TaxID=285 RepID=UPI0015FA9037|nr:penicillin acylase family protein [Comamonas testosteroni]